MTHRAEFWHVGYFWPGSDKFEFWKSFNTFDGVMT